MPRPPWPEEHIDILKKKYPKLGTNIPELLKFHTPSSIRVTANSRGIRYTNKRYSVSEIETIKKNYNGRIESIKEFLGTHSINSLYSVVSNRGLYKKDDEHYFGRDVRPGKDWCNWFSGFCDGESSLYVATGKNERGYRPYCVFVIQLRIDDAPLMQEMKDNLKVGHIRYISNHRARDDGRQVMDVAKYQVNKIQHLTDVIVPLFEKHPLRSKKAKEFPLWREAVEICSGNRTERSERLLEIIFTLKEMRAGASR